MELDEAVEVLWAEGIYAESGMCCTGPIVMVNEAKLNVAIKILAKAGYDVGEAKTAKIRHPGKRGLFAYE
ncbi:MAG: hypothetical protein GX947_09075 [Tissierellia bacterium]|nr:hypothetical protein [Tissierellia bacterium]